MTTAFDDEGPRSTGPASDEASHHIPDYSNGPFPPHPSSGPRPDSDKHIARPKHHRSRQRQPKPVFSQPQQRAMRRMSSVPELRESNRGGQDAGKRAAGYASQSVRYRRKRSNPNLRQWPADHDPASAEGLQYDAAYGGNRLIRQKSIERGIVQGRAPSSFSDRIPSGVRTPRSRHGSLSGGNSQAVGSHVAGNVRSPPTPDLVAWNNSVARGFTGAHPSSPQRAPQALPHNIRLAYRPSPPHTAHYASDPSSSAPDLHADYDIRPYASRAHLDDPPRSHPYPSHLTFSALSSANTSPHSSFGLPPPDIDALRGSFRSVLSNSEVNRSSGFTTDSEAYYSEAYQSEAYYTESSNAMTVDEAIRMYASDSDDEQDEHRRSHGDSVLGGATMQRDGSMEDSGYRSKGDSVLGGKRSPISINRREEEDEDEDEDDMLAYDHKRASGDSVGRGNEADAEGDSPDEAPSYAPPSPPLAPSPALEKFRFSNSAPEHPEPSPVRGEFYFPGTAIGEPNSSPMREEFSPAPEQSEASPETLQENGAPRESLPGAVSEPVSTPEETPSPPPPRPPQPVSQGPTTPAPRDRYGFKKGTQYISVEDFEKWEREYDLMLAKRREKWDKLLRDSGLVPGEEGPVRFPPKSRVVKRYIRKGIPPEWRGAAWFWYAGGQRYLNKHPGLYEELVEIGAKAPDAELIERDLHRTFPDNIHFKADPSPDARASKLEETAKVQALRRVLRAFAVYAPRIGYCQSLNFLAGMLLLFMSEEKAFWMLYILTHIHLPGSHQMNLEGSSVDQWVLMMSVRESMPTIWGKIGATLDGVEIQLESTKLPAVTLCTSAWFMSGFIGSLPTESVLRVWDCLFYEGSKTLFRIALAIFKSGENQIRTIQDPMEIITTVQQIPRRFQDAGALIEACYKRRNGFGHLSQETVDERRRTRRQVLAAERALAKRDPRVSRDDFALRSPVTGGFRGGFNDHHHHGSHRLGANGTASPVEIGRKWKKMLVKT